MTLELSNHSANPYIYYPFEVEDRDGTGCKKCFEFGTNRIPPIAELAPHAITTRTLSTPELPRGFPVRFRVRVQEKLTGLGGFLERRELRFRHEPNPARKPPFSYPFDKQTEVFESPSEVVSQEFIVP